MRRSCFKCKATKNSPFKLACKLTLNLYNQSEMKRGTISTSKSAHHLLSYVMIVKFRDEEEDGGWKGRAIFHISTIQFHVVFWSLHHSFSSSENAAADSFSSSLSSWYYYWSCFCYFWTGCCCCRRTMMVPSGSIRMGHNYIGQALCFAFLNDNRQLAF